MKLLTLNSHSLQEENYLQKLTWFVRGVLELRPDIIAMQEVNQTMTAAPVTPELLMGYVPAPGHHIPVLEDNHALQTALWLQSAGVPCSWTWLPVKRGYGKYDEGLALFSLSAPIARTDVIHISRRDDYEDWRTRKVLGIQTEGCRDWFYTVHMGWWGDQEEPFADQWATLERELSKKKSVGPVWLLGDFNAPAHVRGESCDAIRASGWQDTYELAATKDDGITVAGVIDGWRERLHGDIPDGMRIDYIWRSVPTDVIRSRVVFSGTDRPAVSDHFGVLAETEEDVS